ncbi:sensor histidine kinase [Pseudarthrobacter sp. P1]|uniref:sensor histidine kinase n=1 Tax=Pseudarthrobacter sp. P1 TaxID=3418418 RepID=UPI003CF6ED1E
MDLSVAAIYLLVSLPSALPPLLAGQYLHPALILLSAALLMVRRHRPVAMTVALAIIETVLLAVEPYSSNASLSLWFALYAVAVQRRVVPSFAMAGAVSVPLVVILLFFFRMPAQSLADGLPGQKATGIISSVVIVLANVVATGIGVSVHRNRDHEAQLRTWAERNAKLASVAERNRIAREMHDVVAHSLTVMVALSDGAAVVVKRDPDRAGTVLEELSRTGRTALADMRRVLGVLRQEGSLANAALEPLPGGGGIDALLAGFRRAGLPLHLTQTGPPLPRDPAFALTVYRILQESLTNALRYGRSAGRVGVEIEHREQPGGTSRVVLRIADDGRGTAAGDLLPRPQGTGQGIPGMKERAGIYAGTVTAGPGPHGGWVVEAILNPAAQCPRTTASTEPAKDAT